jgi:hypothetical protein
MIFRYLSLAYSIITANVLVSYTNSVTYCISNLFHIMSIFSPLSSMLFGNVKERYILSKVGRWLGNQRGYGLKTIG